MINQHEHREFIFKIMHKVKTYSKLVSLNDADSYRLKLTDSAENKVRHERIEEAMELIEDIENSLYLKLDEVGDSR